MSKQTGFSFASSKKSLIETIDEIKKSKMPRNEKIVALKACGLREKEISDMLKVYVPSGSTSTRFVYTFGVEIECVHAERNALIEAGRQNGVDIHSEGYNHTDNKSYFKIVSDASVGGDVDPNEVVSPVLNGNTNGMATLKKAIKSLDAVGARVNSTCGLHVHIGAAKLTGEQYVNVFKNYQKLERLIVSWLLQEEVIAVGQPACLTRISLIAVAITILDVMYFMETDIIRSMQKVLYVTRLSNFASIKVQPITRRLKCGLSSAQSLSVGLATMSSLVRL